MQEDPSLVRHTAHVWTGTCTGHGQVKRSYDHGQWVMSCVPWKGCVLEHRDRRRGRTRPNETRLMQKLSIIEHCTYVIGTRRPWWQYPAPHSRWAVGEQALTRPGWHYILQALKQNGRHNSPFNAEHLFISCRRGETDHRLSPRSFVSNKARC